MATVFDRCIEQQAITTWIKKIYFVKKKSFHVQNQETINPQWRGARLNLSLEIHRLCTTFTGKSNKDHELIYHKLHGQTGHGTRQSCNLTAWSMRYRKQNSLFFSRTVQKNSLKCLKYNFKCTSARCDITLKGSAGVSRVGIGINRI